jgi:hypothetical protein
VAFLFFKLGEVEREGGHVRRIRVVFVAGVIFMIFGVKKTGGEAGIGRKERRCALVRA